MWLAIVSLARALTCDDIEVLLQESAPSIVLNTMREADELPADTSTCLLNAGAPPEIVAEARGREAPSAPSRPNYLAARAAADRGDWDEVHRNVATDSSIAGRYLDAVALVQLRQLRDAMSAFEEVIRAVDAHAGIRVPRARAVELDHDRDLAILGIGRIYYSIERYSLAGSWFDRVGRRSPDWPEAQLEAAWVDFLLSDELGAQARLAALRKAEAWEPGLPWLELLVISQLDRKQKEANSPWACDQPRRPVSYVAPGELEAAHARLRSELEQALRSLEADSAQERLSRSIIVDALVGERALVQVERDAMESARGAEHFGGCYQ